MVDVSIVTYPATSPLFDHPPEVFGARLDHADIPPPFHEPEKFPEHGGIRAKAHKLAGIRAFPYDDATGVCRIPCNIGFGKPAGEQVDGDHRFGRVA